MDITDAPRGELISLIYELIDKVHFLEAEVARLQELLDRKGFSKEGDKPKKAFEKKAVSKGLDSSPMPVRQALCAVSCLFAPLCCE